MSERRNQKDIQNQAGKTMMFLDNSKESNVDRLLVNITLYKIDLPIV